MPAYERSAEVNPFSSKFDRYLAGEASLSADEDAGLALFRREGLCAQCAERSLSDSPFLDPTTAVQVIDRLHDCLRQLAPRPFPDGRHRDTQGRVRLITRTMSCEDYVHLAFDEIRMTGAGPPQVARRLRAALHDLLCVAPATRRAALQEQLDLLDAGVESSIGHSTERKLAKHADPVGLG